MADLSSVALPLAIEALPASLQDVATRAWVRICERHDCNELTLSKEQSQVLARMLACSDYAASVILSHWAWFHENVADRAFERRPKTESMQLVIGSDEASAKAQLRHHRHQFLLHILWRKYANTDNPGETLASLSSLADQLLLAAQCVAIESLRGRFGVPLNAAGEEIPPVVLAMGKLGGYELNFSSDIDVIFLYPEEGETNGPRSLSTHEYFVRVARCIVRLLDDVTEDGFVYRVDTRLRPFGESGPPVVSFASLETYLLQHGRSWERYAYVKARVVGANAIASIASELQNNLIKPFVYRRYLDFGVFESLRKMKAMIAEEEVKRELAENIKLGPGGIREIEFIVQSMQLVRGGSNRKLRRTELEQALQELDSSRFFPVVGVAELGQSYRFLRRLENFLQAIRDQQTHDIPKDPIDRARLALAMQFDGWESLAGTLSKHRSNVSRQFEEVAFRAQGEGTGTSTTNQYSALWESGAERVQWAESLEQNGFEETVEMADVLVTFFTSAPVQQLGTTARGRLRLFVPGLLLILQNRQSALKTLHRVVNIISRVLRRSAYLALLNENRTAMSRLVDVCEQSGYLADEIARYPVLLDEMLDPRLFSVAISATAMQADINERLQQSDSVDSEHRIEVLSQFQRATLFRIAIADFSGEMGIMNVSDALTDLAEVVLAQALQLAWTEMVERYGEPSFEIDGVRQHASFGIIAYGKLAGMEMSYRSDLDLVFLHDSVGIRQQTDGVKPLENSMFFARLVRRIVHFLTTQTSSGALYEVDTRLRPSGRSGLLVTSIDAFERYQIENAWTWEHQALLRSRPVAGSVNITREFERVRSDILRNRVKRHELADEVRQMRVRMRGELDKSSGTLFDLKQGRGGITDIEFLVQYMVLKGANDNEALIHYRDNIRQLGTLGAAACLAKSEVAELQDIYRDYRARLHQLALDRAAPLIDSTEFVEQRQYVVDLWLRELGTG